MTAPRHPEKVTEFVPRPRIIPRSGHNISRTNISENALKVLYRLKNAGYKAYLVGGCVRDLLMDLKPKDFDVATDARPEQIRELFRNCRLIGRRFRLAHIRFGREIIEVSTFRAPHDPASGGGHVEDGRIVRDNVYGDIDDDVWRRDFTINALFYNIEDFSLVDYVGGLGDIRAKVLRLIGDPKTRYQEDPVRMLRAVRFAVKLGFTMHPATEEAIAGCSELLQNVSPSRLFEEFMKLFMGGCALAAYTRLRRQGLFNLLFPETGRMLDEEGDGLTHRMLSCVFHNTDVRFREDKPVTPGFIIAALLWTPMTRIAEEHKSNGLPEMDAIFLAGDAVISRQVSSVALPRRFTRITREIWALQGRLKHHHGKRSLRLLSHPRFRAAYDFLLLRAEAGDNVRDLAEWWTEFVNANRALLSEPAVSEARPAGRRRRRRKRSVD